MTPTAPPPLPPPSRHVFMGLMRDWSTGHHFAAWARHLFNIMQHIGNALGENDTTLADTRLVHGTKLVPWFADVRGMPPVVPMLDVLNLLGQYGHASQYPVEETRRAVQFLTIILFMYDSRVSRWLLNPHPGHAKFGCLGPIPLLDMAEFLNPDALIVARGHFLITCATTPNHEPQPHACHVEPGEINGFLDHASRIMRHMALGNHATWKPPHLEQPKSLFADLEEEEEEVPQNASSR
jgi:hypothetical protein